MFIITNCTQEGNYTPSKADTYEEAYAWMVECTAENIRAGYGHDIEDETGISANDMSDSDIIDWAEENMDGYDFSMDKFNSTIVYTDGNFNEMKIFNLDEI